MNAFFKQVENFQAPSTILFRSIELSLVKKRLQKLLNKKIILDLGCGDGTTAQIIFSKKIAFGLDNDHQTVKKAKQGKQYRHVLQADAANIPLLADSIDLVFSNSVIEHIKNLDPTLKEVKRILKKDGVFIFTAPNNKFISYSIFSWMRIPLLPHLYGFLRNRKFHHYHCYSLKQWTRLLADRGLKIIDSFHYINRQAAEYWDFLLILFYLLNKISQSLADKMYNNYFRRKIYKICKTAHIADENGAAICIAAQKK